MFDRSFLGRALTPAFAAGAIVLAAALFGLVNVPVLSPGLSQAAMVLGLKASVVEHLPEVSPETLASGQTGETETTAEGSVDFQQALTETGQAVTGAAVPVDEGGEGGEVIWDPWAAVGKADPVGIGDQSNDRSSGADEEDAPQGTKSGKDRKDKPQGGLAGEIPPQAGPTETTPAADPPPPPVVISNVNLTAVSPFAATVTWRTSLPSRSQVSYGSDGLHLWSSASNGLEHSASLRGLSMGQGYQFRVVAWDNYGRREQSSLESFATPRTADATMTISGDTILLNGQPFFPKMIMDGCDRLTDVLRDGLNLFLLHAQCADEAASLHGKAFAVRPHNSHASGGHILGRSLPDEWDNSLPNNVTSAQLEAEIHKTSELEFLTLTNHFYSYAEPLPQGRGMYPSLVARGDIIGWDLYPLQIWCRDNAFQHVFHGQRELHALSGGKPTYQWIEVTEMERDCGKAPTNKVTPKTVRAETWLAIAGGADGIAYFPYYWNSGVGGEIARSNQQISALAPALLSPDMEAQGEGSVLVGARNMNGAVYLIAVNTNAHAAQSTRINVPSLNGRPLTVYGEGRRIDPSGDSFTDTFEPLGVHIYIADPA